MGSSSSTTTGYKYYLGMHLVLCHGPIDHVREIYVDDDLAWSGYASDDRINIDEEELFGGTDLEGGISGDLDILMGNTDQGQNDYLQSVLETDIPAYRGVVSAVLRQMYLGMNPYLKNWMFRCQRIYTTSYGGDQWYSEKAGIGVISNTALYIAMDISGSMDEVTSNGETRLANMKTGLEDALTPLLSMTGDEGVDIKVAAYSSSAVTVEYEDVDGTDIQSIIDWINAVTRADLPTDTSTDYEVAVAAVGDFFTDDDLDDDEEDTHIKSSSF